MEGGVADVRKFARAADVVAMRTFVDFLDPRRVGTAAFGAAETNCLDAMRLLHELRADFDKPNTHDGGVPAGIAAGNGHTAMVQLLYDLGAEANRARAGDGVQFTALHRMDTRRRHSCS